LSEFTIVGLAACAYSSKYGPFPCKLQGHDQVSFLNDCASDKAYAKGTANDGHTAELQISIGRGDERTFVGAKLQQTLSNGTIVVGTVAQVKGKKKNKLIVFVKSTKKTSSILRSGNKNKNTTSIREEKNESFSRGDIAVTSAAGMSAGVIAVTSAKKMKQKLYQDQYTLQIVVIRDSLSVLWNLCFSLVVIDVM